jgi:hypothetical protein
MHFLFASCSIFFGFEGGACKRSFEQTTNLLQDFYWTASICLCFVTSLLESLSNYLKQVTQGSTAHRQILIFVVLFLVRCS